jgi:hypothetical protein
MADDDEYGYGPWGDAKRRAEVGVFINACIAQGYIVSDGEGSVQMVGPWERRLKLFPRFFLAWLRGITNGRT